MRLSEDEKTAIREVRFGDLDDPIRRVIAPDWPEDGPLPTALADRLYALWAVAWRADRICRIRQHRANATRPEFV